MIKQRIIKLEEIDNWDKRFLELAKFIATWSKDPSKKVGAVITDNNNRIISTGFNGFPRKLPDDETLHSRDIKLSKIIHAETNAILFANRDLTNCNIYVYPLLPCSNCMSNIIQSGISKVISIDHNDDNWNDSNNLAIEMAKLSDLEVLIVEKHLFMKNDKK